MNMLSQHISFNSRNLVKRNNTFQNPFNPYPYDVKFDKKFEMSGVLLHMRHFMVKLSNGHQMRSNRKSQNAKIKTKTKDAHTI